MNDHQNDDSAYELTASDQALSENFKSPFIFTVSELTKSLQSILRSHFSTIWVTGEVSKVVTSSRGHMYFTLKDEAALLSSVIFHAPLQQDPQIRAKLVQGAVIECCGTLSFYAKQGTCQLIVQEVRSVGVGTLQLAFLAQREAFIKAGLFANERKQPLPPHAHRIGIITSLTGAVIRDIMKTLSMEGTIEGTYGRFEITLYESLVQGPKAPSQIVKQIKRANAEREVEILILTRGGGSLEELASFNDPAVVQSVCDSTLPIISAVGHETDWVLTDEAADCRTSTPTAAAELLLKNRQTWVQMLLAYLETSRAIITENLLSFKYRLSTTALHRLPRLLQTQLALQNHKLQVLRRASTQALATHFHRKQQGLGKLREVIHSLSPQEILNRGYVVVEKNKKRIPRANALTKADQVTLIFQDNHHSATID